MPDEDNAYALQVAPNCDTATLPQGIENLEGKRVIEIPVFESITHYLIDKLYQIKPCIDAIMSWTPGEPFPEGIGAKIPKLEMAVLPSEIDDFGETLEPIDPNDLAGFYELEDDTG